MGRSARPPTANQQATATRTRRSEVPSTDTSNSSDDSSPSSPASSTPTRPAARSGSAEAGAARPADGDATLEDTGTDVSRPAAPFQTAETSKTFSTPNKIVRKEPAAKAPQPNSSFPQIPYFNAFQDQDAYDSRSPDSAPRGVLEKYGMWKPPGFPSYSTTDPLMQSRIQNLDSPERKGGANDLEASPSMKKLATRSSRPVLTAKRWRTSDKQSEPVPDQGPSVGKKRRASDEQSEPVPKRSASVGKKRQRSVERQIPSVQEGGAALSAETASSDQADTEPRHKRKKLPQSQYGVKTRSAKAREGSRDD